jgi:hypothetical protein
MKILLVAAFLLSPSIWASETSIQDFTYLVKNKNYTVLEQAEKVYQARQRIEFARGELLPSLNVWKLVNIVTNPLDISSWAEIAPFLSPSNWFRLEQNKVYYQAELHGYSAMLGNQVMNSRILFMKVNQDHRIMRFIRDYKTELESVYDIIKLKIDLGMEPPESGRELKIRILALNEDLIRMRAYLSDARSELAYIAGYAGNSEINPKDLRPVEISSKGKITYDRIANEVIYNASELKQFDEFLRILPSVSKEIQFSFLGMSSASQGTAGGVFDQVPIPSGLGFATAPAMKIAKSQERVIRLQRQGVYETLLRQTKSATDRLAAEIDVRPFVLQRRSVSQELASQYLEKLKLGQKIDLVRLADAFHAKQMALAAVLENEVQFRMQKEKIDRLKAGGDYE